MKKTAALLVLIFSGSAFASGGPSRPPEGAFIIKPGPNWTFLSGKKSTIELPKGDKIIFGSKLVKFEKWQSTHREQLLLFPEYNEPYIVPQGASDLTPVKKELEVFDARFAFVVAQPIAKFNRESLLNIKFISEMDPNFAQQDISKIIESGDPLTDEKPWCQDQNALCVESLFKLSGLPKKILNFYYGTIKGRKDPAPISILLQSELSYQEDSPFLLHNSESRVVTQKTFYIDHFFQYAVTNLVFHKLDESHTLVVGMTAIGVQEDVLNIGGDIFANFGLNLTARDFIMGGTGLPLLSGVENGLTPYAQEVALNLQRTFKSASF